MTGPLLSANPLTSLSSEELRDRVDLVRVTASRRLDPVRKAELGQFMSPGNVAGLMASMLRFPAPHVHILDAGAGIGSLFAAAVAEACSRPLAPASIAVTAYELDDAFVPYLSDTMELCRSACEHAGIEFSGQVVNADFIAHTVDTLRPSLFARQAMPKVNCIIMNPPYLKIHSQSRTRDLLRQIGVETSNLYTGFLGAAIQLLEPDGELVAITPRSFCNGPYFRGFRQAFLSEMAFRRLHVFESRQQAFRDDDVLQETVIFHAVKHPSPPERVLITSSAGPGDEDIAWREVPFAHVVHPGDPQVFIRVLHDEIENDIAERMAGFESSLRDLGLSVSTGRVVEFRAKEHLRHELDPTAVPLIYPTHFANGGVRWPKPDGKKPNAIVHCEATNAALVPVGNYVLVKRFSSKEEKRRVVATVFEPTHVSGDLVGFENHLNYFHHKGSDLDLAMARGLAAFLNSSLVDSYFRQFNGHTQVNATDLRSLPYPTAGELRELGRVSGIGALTQDELDVLIETRLLKMDSSQSSDPIRAKQKVTEALSILRDLGLPRAQQGERSALTLLALLELRPESDWADARQPLQGVTQMMGFFAEHYGKRYAPNSRETVRRQTLHQFLDAGLVLINPDKPDRPTNSGQTVYQIESSALALLRTYGSPQWDHGVRAYLASAETLASKYAQERTMQRIPITYAGEQILTLSPGGQNVLVQQIIEEFAARFTPGGHLLYVGDTDEKFALFDEQALSSLGVSVDAHGKMPDVVIYHTERNWLILIEAVTSHGPVDPKRRRELEELFTGSQAGLVFVTAFLDRRAMAAFLDDISWETEVWVADYPSHLIHFNGERFLGPD